MFRSIYVYYPRGQRTGGPEALHQLVDALRGLGQDAYLVPLPGTENRERVADYERYAAPEADAIEDAPGNAVVAPEIFLDPLRHLKNATGFCWWLSIDNAPEFRDERDWVALSRDDPSYRRRLRQKRGWDRKREPIDYSTVVHLAQSEYSWSFLYARLNVVPTMLSDYTPLHRFDNLPEIPDRGLTIAYNHSKAHPLTSEVEKHAPHLEFVPIRDMEADEVIRVLGRSAVYLDLGAHPGKDRMPREAALAGAVSIVARRGAGAFWDDVPIPWEHKVSMVSPVQDCLRALDTVLSDLPAARTAQAGYVETIRGEQQRFIEETAAVFVEGRREFGSEGPSAA